jgi:hypothetical protein
MTRVFYGSLTVMGGVLILAGHGRLAGVLGLVRHAARVAF